MKVKLAAAVSVAGAALALAACGSSGSSGSGGGDSRPIVIGASVPLSGPLAGFGSFMKWGYQNAVDRANAAGGITVDGKKRKVKLVLLDDKTDANTASNNINRLISRSKADALLGSCTGTLVEPGALVAERNRVPFVTACDPVESFTAVRKWTYAWDLFFSAADLTAAPFRTVQTLGLKTNKKVAIIHANGSAEGIIGDQLWPAMAKRFGWSVVSKQTLPLDATQFASAVQRVKASGADMVLVIFATPPAIAIRKQMQSAGLTPKMLVMEEGGEPVQFARALGKLSDGVIVGGYWDPSFPYPGAASLRTQFEKETGQTFSQHIADSDAAAQVLLDAIKRAGTTDKAKVNSAIGQTNGTYVVGPIKFGPDQTSTLPIVELQWQGGKTVVVGPTEKFVNGKILFPVPGGGT